MRKTAICSCLLLSCSLPFSMNKSFLEPGVTISYNEDRDTFLVQASKIINKYHKDYPSERKDSIANYIWYYGSIYDIDPYLLLGLFALESGFDSSVVSSRNAQGIGQFLPGTWKWIAGEIGILDSLHITSYKGGIHATCYYLYNLRRETGDIDKALKLYSGWGVNHLKERGSGFL